MYIVDWDTRIITIPKSDLVDKGNNLYELQMSTFHDTIRQLEYDFNKGFSRLQILDYIKPVTLSGTTYSGFYIIKNGYSITFENGLYAVQLTGGNNNLFDHINKNSVSVSSSNSAGLISSPAIEFASFDGGVTVDVNSQWSGTVFPIGTGQRKVNNIPDAKIIADKNGFNKLYLHSDITLGTGDNLNNFMLVGRNHVEIQVNILPTAEVNNIRITNCEITGTLDGDIDLFNCIVFNLVYVNGHIHNCGVKGSIVLGGNKDAVIANCYTIDQDNPLVIDMGGSGQSLAMPNYSGIVTIKNLDDVNQEIGIGLNAGMVNLENTILNGTVIISGSGILNDNTGTSVQVNTDGLMNTNTVSSSVWNRNMDI